MDKSYHKDNTAFLIYKDWEEVFCKLSDEDAGRLIKALFAYAARGEMPDFNGVLEMAFTPMRNYIDRKGAEWERKCAKNAENIRKRWEKKNAEKGSSFPENSSEDGISDKKQEDAENNAESSVENNDTENGTVISIQEISDEIYSVYPRKYGKAKGYEYIAAWLTKGRELKGMGRIKLNHGQLYCAAKDYAMDCEENQTEKQFIQQFSTFMSKTVADYVENSEEGYERYMEKKYGVEWRDIKFIYK